MTFASNIVIFTIEIISTVTEFWESGPSRTHPYLLNKLVKDISKLAFYGVNAHFFELTVLIKSTVKRWNIYP